jgi:predicted transcriptional regulator
MAEITVSLPDELLERIDAEAKQHSISRGALIALAAQRELERREAMDAAIARGRELFKDAGPFESGELVRADRDWRDERDHQR